MQENCSVPLQDRLTRNHALKFVWHTKSHHLIHCNHYAEKRLDRNGEIAVCSEFMPHTNMHPPAEESSVCCKATVLQIVNNIMWFPWISPQEGQRCREVELQTSLAGASRTEWFAKGYFSRAGSCWWGGSTQSPSAEEQPLYSLCCLSKPA